MKILLMYTLKNKIEELLPVSSGSSDPRYRLVRAVEMAAFEDAPRNILEDAMRHVDVSEPAYKLALACCCLLSAQEPARHTIEAQQRLNSVREASRLLSDSR
jgi:hypothetical protein